MKKKKIVVAISGGVDSSVAAQILKDEGHELIGVFLHFWKDEQLSERGGNKCCSLEALLDARRVCRKIGIPLYTMNFSGDFKKDVVDNFLNEYQNGRTPNPCVQCNKFVKLGLLIRKARELGFDYVASGHYAQIQSTGKKDAEIYKMFKGKDNNKDQSYFLYALDKEQIKHLIFPLGKYTKDEVRAMAEKYKLPVAKKSESQEICFIPGKSHNLFLEKYLDLKKGPIKNFDGEILGEHQGLPLYTIGQRKGIEIGGIGPFYAAKMDYESNTLYVVEKADDSRLFSAGLEAINVNWLSIKKPSLPFKCEAVIRYRHKPVNCEITKNEEGIYKVEFSEPQRAVTSGQSVVFYSEDEVLGGGIIR